jgi:hypothetical protein
LIRPDKHLRELIAHATPEQNARAIVKAKEYYAMCMRMGVEPSEAARVLKEALEMEITGNVGDVGDVCKARDDLFTRRQYGRNYREE